LIKEDPEIAFSQWTDKGYAVLSMAAMNRHFFGAQRCRRAV
jgi:hypothetical protein